MTEAQVNQKQEILEASTKLYMKHGIRSVSMDDLARHLGISKKTIYQYYENKEALVEDIVHLHVEKEKMEIANILKHSNNAIDEMHQIAKMVLRTLGEVSSGTMFDLQKYYRKQWVKITELEKKLTFEVIKQNLIRGKAAGIYRDTVNEDIVARLYVEMAHSIVDDDIFSMQEFGKQELYKQAFNYHINGILSPKGEILFQKLNSTD